MVLNSYDKVICIGICGKNEYTNFDAFLYNGVRCNFL